MSMPPPPPSDSFPQPPGSSFPPQPPGFQVYPAGAPMPMKRGNSGMAVASLVCSLVGVIPCFWVFQIMGLLGTIFGFVGLKQTKSGERGGRGLAVAGVDHRHHPRIGVYRVLDLLRDQRRLRARRQPVRVHDGLARLVPERYARVLTVG